MTEFVVSGETLPQAYHLALKSLYEHGEEADCADWNTQQKELGMTIYVDHPFQEPMISKYFIGGPDDLEQYVLEMTEGILDFEVENGKWDYTYHDRMVFWDKNLDQIEFVKQELKRNPSSRRAVIDVRNNYEDMGSADPACLQHIQFFIRNGALDCMVLFRSNDACKATFMNAFALIMLQKKIADELGVPVGTYTHRANSFHCYARDYLLLEGYWKRLSRSTGLEDDAYYYEGDWKEEMEKAKKDIFDKVEELKTRS